MLASITAALALAALTAVALVALGGFIVWPIARRVGSRNPDAFVRDPAGGWWEPIETDNARRWRPATPPARALRDPWHQRGGAMVRRGWAALDVRRKAIRPTLAVWWAATAPRDPDRPARATTRPSYRYIGRPPLGVAR